MFKITTPEICVSCLLTFLYTSMFGAISLMGAIAMFFLGAEVDPLSDSDVIVTILRSAKHYTKVL